MNRTILLTAAAIALLNAGAARAADETPALYLSDALGAPGTNESHHGIGPDGRLWFTRADKDFTTAQVMTCEPDGDTCGDVQTAPFESSPYDAGVTFSADGRTLIFTSKRSHPSLTDEWNLWVTRLDGTAWSKPEPLAALNSAKADCCALLGSDGRLYFSSERDGSWDIFAADAAGAGFAAPLALPPAINSLHMEWPAWISSDGATLLFSSIRQGGLGGDDLYVSCFVNGAWTEARNLGAPINSAAFEDSPSFDGTHLIFSSTRPTPDGEASANVYRVPVAPLCP